MSGVSQNKGESPCNRKRYSPLHKKYSVLHKERGNERERKGKKRWKELDLKGRVQKWENKNHGNFLFSYKDYWNKATDCVRPQQTQYYLAFFASTAWILAKKNPPIHFHALLFHIFLVLHDMWRDHENQWAICCSLSRTRCDDDEMRSFFFHPSNLCRVVKPIVYNMLLMTKLDLLLTGSDALMLRCSDALTFRDRHCVWASRRVIQLVAHERIRILKMKWWLRSRPMMRRNDGGIWGRKIVCIIAN